jgi:hypothetical protein
VQGPADQASALGEKLADELVKAGAADVLSAVRNGVTQ